MSTPRARRPLVRTLLMRPLLRFLELEAAGGVVLLLVSLLALAWANSPFGDSYFRLWEGTQLTVGFDRWVLSRDLRHWINDGVMAVFFFVVGLEIKRELLVGELSTRRQATLPLFAAVGGMVVPASIYLLLNAGTPLERGWGVPMATDIAFSLGILGLLGSRAPLGLKVYLTALAIIDDLGAVLVIALFYNQGVSWGALGVAVVFLMALVVANRLGVANPVVYGVLGCAVWLAVLESGVHATVAGVAVAMTIPAKRRLHADRFVRRVRGLVEAVDLGNRPGESDPTATQRDAIYSLEHACRNVQSPLFRFEHALHGYVAFLILPAFAMANSGVVLTHDLGELVDRATLGIALGLAAGKPVGVFGMSWLAVRLGLARLPSGVSWPHIGGAAVLCGVGFTMSLFIGGLAFLDPQHMAAAKIGILAGSSVSAVLGLALLWMADRNGRSG